MSKVKLVQGSVLEQDCQVLVNAANIRMRGGSGLDGAFHQAAGPNLLAELEKAAPYRVKTGECVVTTACDLLSDVTKLILHVAGPVYDSKVTDDIELLSAYYNVFRCAYQMNVTSIAVPGISVGIFGFPIERAAKLAVMGMLLAAQNFASTCTLLEEVRFVMFKDEEYDAFYAALESIQGAELYGLEVELD